MRTTLLLVAALCMGMVAATPSGVPTAACQEMIPMHLGTPAQPLPSPYTVTLSQSRVQPRALVTVTISAPAGDSFRGFFAQARDASGTPVGTFEASAGVVVIDCLGGLQNAAAHAINDDKTSIAINWVSPSTPTDVTFNISTVRVFSTFWMGQTVPLTVQV